MSSEIKFIGFLISNSAPKTSAEPRFLEVSCCGALAKNVNSIGSLKLL